MGWGIATWEGVVANCVFGELSASAQQSSRVVRPPRVMRTRLGLTGRRWGLTGRRCATAPASRCRLRNPCDPGATAKRLSGRPYVRPIRRVHMLLKTLLDFLPLFLRASAFQHSRQLVGEGVGAQAGAVLGPLFRDGRRAPRWSWLPAPERSYRRGPETRRCSSSSESLKSALSEGEDGSGGPPSSLSVSAFAESCSSGRISGRLMLAMQ